MPTALCLYSGGLDSRLAVKIMLACGVKVAVFHAVHAFLGRESIEDIQCRVTKECRELGAEKIFFKETTPAMVALLRRNRFGFGKNLNPCIDCRVATILAAAEFMEEAGADFLVTGEVLGQRPKSQQRFGMGAVAGALPPALKGLLVRPLSAKLLPPTIPEENGMLDREKLYALSGRGRSEQIRLAAEFGLTDYPNPAGGCLLTDSGFCQRMRGLLAAQETVTADDIDLLKVGRQQRLADGTLIVTARDSGEGDCLERLTRPEDTTFITVPRNGALVLVRGHLTPEAESAAAASAVHYSKYRGEAAVTLAKTCGGKTATITCNANNPLPAEAAAEAQED